MPMGSKETGGNRWQRNYYEHIIRDEDDLNNIREYITENPVKWEFDRENPNLVLPQTRTA